MPAAPHRLARASVVTASAALLGAAGHALTGGTVSAPGVATAALLLIGPAWLLAGRERGWLPIAAAQVAGQLAVHVLLAETGGPMAVSGPLPHDLMVHAHVVAAVLVTGRLHRGERHAWAAARRALTALLLGIPTPAAVPDLRGPARPGDRGPLAAATTVLRHALVRRGPPQPA
jgi:hypothetical protein